MAVERVTAEELEARRWELLAEHPSLAVWRPSCTRCHSMWCAENTEGLSPAEVHAVKELAAILSAFRENWPAGGCSIVGHDLQRVADADHGERIICSRSDLSVPRPPGSRDLGNAYRTWAGPQGYLEGVEHATDSR